MSKSYKKTRERNYKLLEELTDLEFGQEYGLKECSVRGLRRKHAPHTSNAVLVNKKYPQAKRPKGYKPLDHHGLTCGNKCKEGGDGKECDIYKLAHSLYYRTFHRGIKLLASDIDKLANSHIEFYKTDSSSKRVEFFKFIDTKILELLDPKIKEKLQFESDGRISRIVRKNDNWDHLNFREDQKNEVKHAS